jgi:hypothetical protein
MRVEEVAVMNLCLSRRAWLSVMGWRPKAVRIGVMGSGAAAAAVFTENAAAADSFPEDDSPETDAILFLNFFARARGVCLAVDSASAGIRGVPDIWLRGVADVGRRGLLAFAGAAPVPER